MSTDPLHISDAFQVDRSNPFQVVGETGEVVPDPPPAFAPGFAYEDNDGSDEYRRQQRQSAWQEAIPCRFWNARLRYVEESVRDDLTAWAKLDYPPNLVILGPVGTGKTWAAVAAVRPHFFTSRSVRFTPVGEMLDALRPGGPESEFRRLIGVGCLIIDDVGSEKGSEWTAERLFMVVNRRWLDRKSTITTSNLSPDELREAVGERTYSRLVGSDALVLALRGEDRRRSAAEEIHDPPPTEQPPAEVVTGSADAKDRIAAMRASRLPPQRAAEPDATTESSSSLDAHSFGDHSLCGPNCPERPTEALTPAQEGDDA